MTSVTTPSAATSVGSPHLIVFANEKGGTGKSTTCVHTAVALAAQGVTVSVIDLDYRQRTVARYLDEPDMPDVDLFWRTSGEQRTSNFLLWQSAYAEMVFSDIAWPDVDRRALWAAIEEYAERHRRYGSA